MKYLKHFFYEKTKVGTYKPSPPRFWSTLFLILLLLGFIGKWFLAIAAIETADLAVMVGIFAVLIGSYTLHRKHKGISIATNQPGENL